MGLQINFQLGREYSFYKFKSVVEEGGWQTNLRRQTIHAISPNVGIEKGGGRFLIAE